MFQYDFCQAKTSDDVCRFLDTYGEHGRVVAGGTDLLVQIRDKDRRFESITNIMDITPLETEMRYVKEDGDELEIGALCTHTDLENDPLIRQYLPLLGEACATVGSPQIRNRGTIGGSICNASPAADPLTPLVASDAKVIIKGISGTREVKLSDFYHGKGQTDLGRGEFVLAFRVRKLENSMGSAFAKLGRRKALAISRLNAAVVIKAAEDGKIESVSIAPGCIFTVPERVAKAEEVLTGSKPSEEDFQKAGEAVSAEMIERTGIRWSTEYKKPAVEAIVRDALEKAYAKAVLASAGKSEVRK